MRFASSSPRHLSVISLGFIVATATIFTTSCSSGSMSGPPGPTLSGSTSVTVMLTSTANDQLAEFDLGFQSVTLTSQSGKTVTLLSSGSGLGAEFVHMNGTAEPLVTASVPQDVYTAATVTLNGAQFVCIELGPEDGEQVLDTSTYNYLGMPASDVTVALPSPITVTGTNMGLSLDLLVAESATYSACFTPDGVSSFSITPTFNLTPLTFSSSPTSEANGKVTGLDGQVTAIGSGGSSLTLSLPDDEGARPIIINFDSNTAYQGISNFSALTVGTFVDMDGAIQSDGSVLATRISVEDTSAVDVFRGPLMEVTPSVSAFLMLPRQEQGSDFLTKVVIGSDYFRSSGAAFKISGQFANLVNLPFVPTFSASNMVPGQEVYVSIESAIPVDGSYPMATTMTLMPQTINGTVTASSQSGDFTDYTVSLAPYDLFPMLAVQPGQTTVENNPSQVEVYVDSNTQQLNKQKPLAAGSTLRFYGLVFNDNGTLRMDCAQVNDGVAFTAPSSASKQSQVEKRDVQRVRRKGFGEVQLTTSVTTRQP
jgi:hypothetical protein